MESSGAGGAAPTGCYKCGRPGHWSRDCPSSAPSNPSDPTSNPSPNPNTNPGSSGFNASRPHSSFSGSGKSGINKSSEKPKKVPRTRPKLTPELLLSDDGLGYVLRHFPSHFKYRGRGHEVADLGNLISLYSEWHSHVLPKFSFDHFVQRVEGVGATRRVKMCIRGLKERVANGGDPTKLHETPAELSEPNHEQGAATPGEALNSEELNHIPGDPSLEGSDAVGVPEDMLQDIYKKVTEEAPQNMDNVMAAVGIHSDDGSAKELPSQVRENEATQPSKIKITEEQKARMEANRLKAIQRASARVSQL